MNNRIFLQRYSKVLILQISFVITILIFATALRYFDNGLFSEVMEIYDEYVRTEISLTLVLDGE